MITLKNVRDFDGNIRDYTIQSDLSETLDAKGLLTIMPALIDPHVHFRVPGAENKEDWKTAAKAAIAGGITHVFDMPNNIPSCITKQRLDEKKALIDQQLKAVDIPLRYDLYLGADQNHLEDITKVKNEIIGIKVFMGSTTGELLMTDETALDRTFQIAAQNNLIVAVHAEDEETIILNTLKFADDKDPSTHSKIRDRQAAIIAVQKAISLARKYSTQLMILHVTTKEELELIRQAKKNELLIYAEATPHHLFLNESDYAKWGNKVVMNPPLRTLDDQAALWQAINDGTIDTIGSDHAPHTLNEKQKPYGKAPSGVPGIETTLPLLLDAYNKKKITSTQLISLTCRNIENIFRLQHTSDVVLVDLEMVKKVTDNNLKTKCGWSPFAGMELKGWPIYTILKGRIYPCA